MTARRAVLPSHDRLQVALVGATWRVRLLDEVRPA
jgi:hypothetical protein